MADRSIRTVVAQRLCCGCGVCLVACPAKAVKMIVGEHYNYARVDERLCAQCGLCLEVCPQSERGSQVETSELAEPIACYLAHAGDEVVRRDASSGGFVTALLLYLLEAGAITGAVVVRTSAESPFVQESFVARSREQIISARGSRYTPVSMCGALTEALQCPGRYAFVGKPCEIRALRNLQERCPDLKTRVVLTVGLFCAQTPARSRTKAFLESRGLDPSEVHAIAYRGAGWPGRFRAWNGTGLACSVPYREAWDYLASGAPSVSCLLCADGVALQSDISAGDPWSLASRRSVGEGRTLVTVWTEVGRKAVEQHALAGGAVLDEAGADCWVTLGQAQRNRRAAAAGKQAAYRAISGDALSLVRCLQRGLPCFPALLRRRFSRVYY